MDTTDQRHGAEVTDNGIIVTSGTSWQGIVAEVRRQPPPPLAEQRNDRHIIAFHLGRPHRVVQHRDGQIREIVRRRGDLLLDPASQPVAYDWSQPADALLLRLDPALVLAAAEAPGLDLACVELLPTYQARDARIEQVALALLGELHADAPGGRLYAESLATMLAVHLVRHHSSLGHGAAQRIAQPPSGNLSGPALRSVQEYVEAHLDRSLTLSELAAVAGLSQRHFVRLFRATTGQSAHRYLVARRVERAKLLLTTTDLPIARIAALVGFADRSHLAAHFRQLVGVTPAALRRRSG